VNLRDPKEVTRKMKATHKKINIGSHRIGVSRSAGRGDPTVSEIEAVERTVMEEQDVKESD